MELAKVEGTIVSTVKSDRLHGYKLLLLNLINPDLSSSNNYVVAVDSVGAGAGEGVCTPRDFARVRRLSINKSLQMK